MRNIQKKEQPKADQRSDNARANTRYVAQFLAVLNARMVMIVNRDPIKFKHDAK